MIFSGLLGKQYGRLLPCRAAPCCIRPTRVHSTAGRSFFCTALVLLAGAGAAQDNAAAKSSADDCWRSDIGAYDDPSLTRQERIALLEKALLEAVHDLNPCHNTLRSGAQDDASKAAAAGSPARQGRGTKQGATASGSQRADATASEAQTAGATASGAQTGTAAIPPREGAGDTGGWRTTHKNKRHTPPGAGGGKIPEDIPQVDNDDIIAQEFRSAALAEEDPAVREKLWDEYRRYKNLPPPQENQNEERKEE